MGGRKSGSGEPLRVLIVEDREADAELMVYELRRDGFAPEWVLVATEEAFRARLNEAFDVILADFTMPGFDARRCLEIMQEVGSDLPLIVVTGSISEEVAVECMKRGAADYLLKDRLARLGPAVRQALEQHRVRVLSQQAQEALRESEERFRRLAENAPDIVFRYRVREQPCMEYVSPAVEEILGFEPEEFYKDPNLARRLLGEDWELVTRAVRRPTFPAEPLEVRCLRKNGERAWLEVRAVGVHDQEGVLTEVEGIARDITARKEAEAALRKREREFKALVENAPDIIARFDAQGRHLYINPAITRVTGRPVSDYLGKTDEQIGTSPERAALWRAALQHVFTTGQPTEVELKVERPEGDLIFHARLVPELGQDGRVETVLAIARDVTEARRHDREREAIISMASALRTARNRDDMLPILLREVCRLLEAAGAALLSQVSGEESVFVVEGADGEWSHLTGRRLEGEHNLTWVVMESRKPLLLEPGGTPLNRPFGNLVGEEWAYLCVPLAVSDQRIGALWVGRKRPFAAEDVNILVAIGDMAANALHRAALHEQTQLRLQRMQSLRVVDMAITSSMDLGLTLAIS